MLRNYRKGLAGLFIVALFPPGFILAGASGEQKEASGEQKKIKNPSPVTVSAHSYSVHRKIQGKSVLKNGKLRPAFGGYETVVGLRFVPPEGSGIVSIEDTKAKIEWFRDSVGKELLAGNGGDMKTKSGSILNAPECRMEIRAPALASPKARSLFVKGTVPVHLAGGTDTFRSGLIDRKALERKGDLHAKQVITPMNGIQLTLGHTKVGASAQMNGTRFVIALVTLEPDWPTVHRFRFFDAKGKELKSIANGNWNTLEEAVHWTGLSFAIPKYESVVIAMEQWKDVRKIDVPFECEISFGPKEEPEEKAKANANAKANAKEEGK